ncbi:MAG: hypothetical protein ACOC88_02485 [Candidatus Bipolaricaulota bacterium]
MRMRLSRAAMVTVLAMAVFCFPLSGQPGSAPYHNRNERSRGRKGDESCPTFVDRLPNWNTYRNEEFGIEFKFPPNGKLDVNLEKGSLTVRAELPKQPDTLLTDKYLSLTVTDSLTSVAAAMPREKLEQVKSKSLTVNGHRFEKFFRQEGAAGSIYDTTAYLTCSTGYYYLLEFVLRSSNPGVYGEDPPPEFDGTEENEVFIKLLSTVRIF